MTAEQTTGKNLLWPIIIASVVIIGLSAVLIFWKNQVPKLKTTDGQAIAERFLEQIRTGKVDDAWNGTSAEFKSIQGKEAFRAYVKSKPVLKAVATFEAIEPLTDPNLTLVVCRYRPEKGSGKITLTLAPFDGQWQIEKLSVD